jgi:hypothetical protein
MRRTTSTCRSRSTRRTRRRGPTSGPENGLIGEDLWRDATVELRSASQPDHWVRLTPTAKVVNGKVVADIEQVWPD